MTALRVAAGAAVAAAGSWGLKALVIGLAGGLDRSPLEGPFFFLGLVLLVVAFAAAGIAATAGRPRPVRILGAVGAVLVGVAASLLVETGVGALVPESAGWVKEEAGLWATSVLTAALLLLWVTAREREREPSG